MMIGNVTTWERNLLDSNGNLNETAGRILHLFQRGNGTILMRTDIFTSNYFGGKHARMQYLHLVWGRLYLSPDGDMDKLRQRILAGESLFHGEIGQAAFAK